MQDHFDNVVTRSPSRNNQLSARYRDQAPRTPKDHNDAEMELYAGVGSTYFIEQNDSGSDTLVADRPPPLAPPAH